MGLEKRPSSRRFELARAHIFSEFHTRKHPQLNENSFGEILGLLETLRHLRR